MNLGLYIHIPFCKIKCDYCSFYSLPLSCMDDFHRNEIIDGYLSALLKEIDLRADELKDYKVDTIYFGGGTPSLLLPSELEKIINHLHKRLNISSSIEEITVECNPENYSVGLIEEYKKLKINRIVLGVQTLNEHFHKFIGRAGGLCDVKILKEFTEISGIVHCVDLIFGIPGQTWTDLNADLTAITDVKFEHISAYTLTIDSGTPIYERKDCFSDIDEAFRNNFECAIDFLAGKGYVHYEVSNYAFPGFESKHNMKYWKFLPYAGFGAGSHSFYDNERYYNLRSVEEYIQNKGDIRQKDIRTETSAAVEYILSGMRLSEGISLKEMERITGRKMPVGMMNIIYKMSKENLLYVEEKEEDLNIKFTREGFFRMDSLVFELTEIFL